MRIILLCVALIAGSIGERAVQLDRNVRDVLQALVQKIEPEPSDRFVAGRGLAPKHRAILARLTPRDVFDLNPTDKFVVQPDEIVFDSVTVSGETATVVLTYGPVPSKVLLTCGDTNTFLLRMRRGGWEVDEAEVWVRCANAGPKAGSEREEQLREVLRIALNRVIPESNPTIVAGAQLSAEARSMLERLVPVLEPKAVETDRYVLPSDHLRINELNLDEDTASLKAHMGEVPRYATLACGTGVSIRMRRKHGGWRIEDHQMTMC